MRRWFLLAGAAAAGCATGPWIDNPAYVQPDFNEVVNNPCLVASEAAGPEAYARVFDACFDVFDDYFEIAISNRYDGRIESHPKIAPGVEQFFKPGSPDLNERMLVFLQSYRYRGVVLIQPADAEGGYFVSVTVFKELEDVPTPTRASAGQAAFRTDPSVERQNEVIDDTVVSTTWIPKGRDHALEQRILCKIRARLK